MSNDPNQVKVLITGDASGLQKTSADAGKSIDDLGKRVDAVSEKTTQGGRSVDEFGKRVEEVGEKAIDVVPPLNRMAIGAGLVAAGFVAAAAGTALLVRNYEQGERYVRQMEASLAAQGRQGELTRDQIAGLVREVDALPGVSRAAARETVAAFAGMHDAGVQTIGELSRVTVDYAYATGRTLPQAAATLKKALDDPAKGAKALDAELNLLSVSQALSIERFSAQGREMEANQVLVDALKDRVSGLAREGMTPLEQSMDRVSNAWPVLMNRMAESKAIENAAGFAAKLVDSFAWLIENGNKVPGAMANASRFLPGGFAVEIAQGMMDAHADKPQASQGDLRRSEAGILAKLQQEAKGGLGLADRYDTVGAQRRTLQGDRAKLESAMRAAQSLKLLDPGNAASYDELAGRGGAGLAALEEKLGKLGQTKAGKTGAQDREAENTIKRLIEQYAQLNGEKSASQTLDRLLADTDHQWTEAQKVKARAIAANIDAQKVKARAIAANIDAQKEMNGELDRDAKFRAQADRELAQVLATQKSAEDALRSQARAVNELIDPWQAYTREVANLDQMLEAGMITWETYGEAVERATDKAVKATTTQADTQDDTAKAIERAVQSNSRAISRDLAAMAVDGTKSFTDLSNAARNFVKELIAIQIQKRYMDPFLKAGTKMIDYLIDGPNVIPGGVGAQPYHLGGLAGRDGGPSRYIHPAYFENAPRFHQGRSPLRPGELPAILMRDEEVLTTRDPRHRWNLDNGGASGGAGPASIKVEIENRSGTPVKATQASPRFDGREMVVSIVLEDLGKNGPIAQAVRSPRELG